MQSPISKAQLQDLVARRRQTTQAADTARLPSRVPLSSAQARVLFTETDDHKRRAGYAGFILNFTGPLNVAALQQAWHDVVAHHEILRTGYNFDPDSGAILQAVHENTRAPFELRQVGPDPTALAQAQDAVYADLAFDTGAAQVARATLLLHGEQQARLCITVHHVAFDGWSRQLMINELGRCYLARLRDNSAALTPTLPYRAWAWAEHQHRPVHYDAALRFWHESLDGLQEFDLFTWLRGKRHSPLPVQRQVFTIESGVAARVRQVAERWQTTSYTVLLTAYKLLLARFSLQRDICVGAPVANRGRPELENIIGCFVNSVAIRSTVSFDQSFATLVQAEHQHVLSALEHQEVPFNDVVKHLYIGQRPATTPLFQALFTLQTPVTCQDRFGPDLALGLQPMPDDTALFDISLNMEVADGGWHGEFMTSSAITDARHAKRLAEHFVHLLTVLVQAPEQVVQTLDWLPAAERVAIAALTHGTEQADSLLPGQSELDLISAFKRVVQAHPEQIAIEESGRLKPGQSQPLHQKLSYQQLDAASDRYAHALLEAGLRHGARVLLWEAKGVRLITAQLAVLKAGASFLCVDPSMPAEKVALQLEDAQAQLLLSSLAAAPVICQRLPSVCLIDLASLSGAPSTLEPLPPGAGFASRCSEQDEAYLIYTSGSTGRPKGISVSHRSLTTLAIERGEPFFAPGRRLLNYGDLSFDMNLFEVWPTLLHGGCLIIAARASDSLADLAEVLQTERIATLGLTPAVFHRLIADYPDALSSLTCLHTGGEPVQFDAVARFLSLPGAESATFANDYGPAENSINSSYAIIRKADLANLNGVIPVGKPLARRSWYLLDDAHNPVPYGAPGMLFVGGVGVANGYINNPALTAERFIVDPSAGPALQSGARLPLDPPRMFNTGDLGYFGEDGNLYFLGRADTQVKVNGVRIELEGIEAALLATGLVRECAATVRATPTGEKRLLAYCVFPTSANLPEQIEALRLQLTKQLPQYFIPSQLLPIESMPLSISGKVDRRRLPEPATLAPTQHDSIPASPTELALIEVFATVFDRSRLAPVSRFFDLGGHSLLVLVLLGKISAACGVRLPAGLFFANSSIRTLAAEIDRQAARADLPSPPQEQHAAPLAPSAEQERLWLLMRISPELGSAYHIPFGLSLHGNWDAPAITSALQRTMARHPLLGVRLPTDPVSGRPEMIPAQPGDELDLLLVNLSQLPPAQRAQRQAELQDAALQQQFDLEQRAAIRFVLQALGADHWYLLVVVHHIVFDGWSRDILIDSLTAELQQPATLAEPDTGYFRYARQQHLALPGQSTGSDAALAYWHTRLAELPQPLRLNTSKTRPARQTYHGHTLHAHWSLASSAHLRGMARAAGVSEFIVLLALTKAFLARVAHTETVLVGSPISNRLSGDYERAVGYFVNMLVSRSEIDLQSNLHTLLAIEARQFYADLQHAVPFDTLLNSLNLPRDASRSTLFQVCVTHMQWPVAKAGPIQVHDIDLPQAKFDLSFDFASPEADDASLLFGLNYNSAVFLPEEAQALQQAFLLFCANVLLAPDAPLQSAHWLAPPAQAILTHMNNTARPINDANVPARLAEVGQQYALQLALLDGEHNLNYQQLLAWVGTLGAWLIGQGVQRGEPVIVLCDRSAELIGASLALLCIGAIYVPADPDYPATRIADIAAHAGARRLVCQPRHLERCPANVQALAIAPPAASDEPQRFAQLPGLQPGQLALTDTAYLMYTSGSTGKPKGVAVNHAGILRLVRNARELEMQGDERFVQSTSSAFDVSVWEIYAALLTGRPLVIIPKPVLLSAELLRERLRECRVTHMCVTPTLARNLQQDCPDVFGALRELWLGGEAVSLELASTLLLAYPQLRLINGYGPTECTVYAVTKHITAATIASGIVPIGQPYSNTTAYVLDEQGRLLPPYFEGEIYLGGIGVANGYWGSPELSAERFLADHVAPAQPMTAGAARLYRTGDRGRITQDGEVEYWGRIDKQIKIRGYRIEPAEVETVLGQYPGVQHALVCARPDANGENCLCAYVIASTDRLSSGALLTFLRQRLPTFLVPQAVVFVLTFPLTGNGKLALDQLPLPAGLAGQPEPPNASASLATAGQADLAAVAAQVRQIWQRLLGHEDFQANSGFFEVGGNSLLAMALKKALCQQFELEISVLDCFTFPDIASMSEYLWSKMQSGPPVPDDLAAHRNTGKTSHQGRVPDNRSSARRQARAAF